MIKVLLALAASGCGLYYSPDVGGLQAGAACDNTDSDPTTSVSFANDVHPLMTRAMGGCSCHLGRQTSGLDLSSYESLRRGGLNSGTKIVIAGDPCHSILPQKVDYPAPFGSRMPLNGPPYLDDSQIQLIRDWIVEGALDN